MKVQKLTCLLGNGQVIEREQITKDNNTLLVVQPRVLTKGTVGIKFLAWYVENGEELVVVVKRELVEEIGYIPDERFTLGSYYQNQRCSRFFNHSYLTTGCEKKAK